ncbi:hypothetical protein NDU88_002837 [Pleurodeles waltl]|uniref:Uncharacterized protein n=1 Tax=Pleurodeles waltl TaxID=8319 RepID=A0AAV7NJ14_PLEWA|nr:hypothetical protein NDU88_002837 [Pleurodeles waltl]
MQQRREEIWPRGAYERACHASEEAWPNQVLIACVHGDQAYYPMATIMFQWRGEEENLRVGVLPHLEEDIIIGTDYIAFTALLNKAGEEHMLHKWWEEVPYDPEVTETQSPKDHLSKRKKRIQKQQYWEKPCESKETAPGDISKRLDADRCTCAENRPENLRSAYCACTNIDIERGLCPLYTERTLVYWPAPAPHRCCDEALRMPEPEKMKILTEYWNRMWQMVSKPISILEIERSIYLLHPKMAAKSCERSSRALF